MKAAMTPDDINHSILKTFLQEAAEHLQNLNSGLLELEKDPNNQEVIEELFREAHTLKGSSRMVGLEEIGAISHKLEDVMGLLKKANLKMSKKLSEAMFVAFDSIQLLLSQASGQDVFDVDVDGICRKLDELAGLMEVSDRKEVTDQRKDKPSMVFERAKSKSTGSFRAIDNTVRVAADKLDRLVNLVGELIINESGSVRREQLLREMQALLRKIRYLAADTDKSEEENLMTLLRDLDKTLQTYFTEFKKEKSVSDTVINELQSQVLELRLLPVAAVFDAYPRMVRDLAQAAKKEVKLILKGRETKLDKKVIEQIKDPLLHIIRNAIDHGFEAAGERKKKGKNLQGELVLEAYQEGEHVVIQVADDGAGINVDKVKEIASAKELVNKKEAPKLSDEEWINFIFEAGFSTKEKVSDVSGRGVGLDVVKKNIEELKGTVTVSSKLGKGTKVVIRLPLTLAISRALIVEVSGLKFAIPSAAVLQTTIMPSSEIHTIEGKETFQLRNKTVGIIDVAEALQIAEKKSNGDKRHLVCLNTQSLVALGVDNFFGETEIIVKSAGSHLKKLPSIAGVTIIDGKIVPILRPSYIVEKQKPAQPAQRKMQETPMMIAKDKIILVVEDSLTMREMEKNMLETCGYVVEEASDGLQALEKVKSKNYDLLIIDVKMPNMGGLELTKALRKQKKFKDLPIIIVSSLGSDEDIERGLEAGADSYLTKSNLSKEGLIETVKEAIG